MIYPNSFEQKIGFDHIRQQITSLCITSGGRKIVNYMSFSDDCIDIERMLSETEEMRLLLLSRSEFHFNEFPECIHDIVRISEEGSIIEQHTLADLKMEMMVFQDCIKFFNANRTDFPLLYSLWSHDLDTHAIIQQIIRIIDDAGEIRSNASDKLFEIRQQIVREQKRAEKQIAIIMKSAKASGIVKENSEISIRDGRAVIPIPAANKRMMRGFIHDSSSTGQTLYVEPDEIFEINNNIRELESEEKQEIVRILRDFTILLRPEIPSIINMDNYLSYIDFLRAKANYALSVSAFKPILSNIPCIHLIRAQHPILLQSLQRQNRQIVPLNIQLDEKNRILVISGPNAGGKSIALKTVALLQYMLQCGLLVPANENSEMGIFRNIFIDIGDEQSIENDLSTYTSHLNNMKFFIENADHSTLILIDEIGSGTEPQLGGAIAEATLEQLCELGAKGVVTTHYASIKQLASKKEGLFNGAMLFDKKEIKPLFQLAIGRPGSSYTFEIARRVGFPSELLDKAAAKSEASAQANYDQMLEELEIEKQQIEKEKEELRVADDFLKEIIDKYTKQLKQLDESKKDIIKKAKAEASDIINNSNRLIENTIREIKEAQAEKERTRKIREKFEKQQKEALNEANETENVSDNPIPIQQNVKIPNKIRKKLSEINKTESEKQLLKDDKIKEIAQDTSIADRNRKFEKMKNDFPDKAKLSSQKTTGQKDTFEVGSLVTAYSSETVGEIVEIKGNEAKVMFDNLAMSVKLEDLHLHQGAKPVHRSSNNNFNSFVQELNEKAYTFTTTIDVRGLRADEALYEIEHYMDDVIMLSIRSFSILHGRGNGVLRKLIRDYLSKIPDVAYFKDASIQNGGDGITEVRMKFNEGEEVATEENQN